MTYRPKPKDTSHVRLTPELKRLTESLAENAHEVWAQQRMSEGWHFGPERNDARKEHPSMVAYDQLSESEKEYDRKTSLETIKVLLALGYTIVSSTGKPVAATASSRAGDELARCRALLKTSGGDTLAEAISFWSGRDLDIWTESVEIYGLLGEGVLQMGEPLVAFDILQEGLTYHPGDIRLRQLFGLALARSAAPLAAKAVLDGLVKEGQDDEETLGLLARIHKDLAEEAVEISQKRQHLRTAYELYSEAFKQTRGYWTGINAATLAVVLGDRAGATTLAQEVRDLCLQELTEEKGRDSYWVLATLGESALILGEWPQAEDWYCRAARTAGKRFGDLCSTRRNARLLLIHLDGDRDRIERCFCIPAVILFAGHMMDQPGRRIPRFPPELEPEVRDALRRRLIAMKAGFGYASVACGSDILFAEAMLDLGADVQVVLPYEKAQFIRDSVDIIPGAKWAERCDAVLQRAAGVTVASDHVLTPGGAQYEYSSLLLQGLAMSRAKQLDTAMLGLAVWDGQRGDGRGGTAPAVERWRESGMPVEVVRLDSPPRTPDAVEVLSQPQAAHRDICGLLFADVVGFSKLTEEEVPAFVTHFFGLVGDLADGWPRPPLVRNTWGDGLYFVFVHARDAGQFGLELCERVAAMNWKEKGLRDLNLRVGVHVGPVYEYTNPVTKDRSYIGTHVSRAARIEPITPPGRVYASQAFAAVAAVEEVKEFTCDYVGRIGMAKNYGAFPTYVVRRRPSYEGGGSHVNG